MDPEKLLLILSHRSARGIIEGLLGIVVMVIGVYLAFWVFGIVLRIIVLLLVAALAIYLFFLLVDGVKKLGGS